MAACKDCGFVRCRCALSATAPRGAGVTETVTNNVTRENNVTPGEPNNVTRRRGRPQLHESNAARQRAYRERRDKHG